MKKTLALIIVSILCLSTFGLLAPRAMAEPLPSLHTYVVWPNGHDDTADIQNAFNAAVAHPWSTVQLEKGTYYISSQLTVNGFQGGFMGMGQGQTTIEALGNMPSPNPEYNTPSSPFWAAPPGPSNPWPALITFEDGSIAISGMTITDTSPTPTQGWYWPTVDGGAWNTALLAGIEITGLEASATVDHVTVIGAAGDYYGYNMANAIHIEGSMLPNGWTNPEADTIMLTGTFSVTNSVFTNAETGAFGNYLTKANVAFCDNTFTAPIASPAAPAEDFAVMDVSSTSVLMCGNHGTATAGFALWAGQSIWKSGLLPSTVTITDNDFQVYEGANAVILQDFGTPSTLKAVVSGNVFQTPSPAGYVPTDPAGYSVIISYSLKSLVALQNTILGGGSAGVYISGGPGLVSANTILGGYYGVFLDSANNVQVTGNVIKNSAEYGIAVTDGSSNNLIAHNIVMNSGVYDLYWDGTGTGNVWIANQYQTSSPPGLG